MNQDSSPLEAAGFPQVTLALVAYLQEQYVADAIKAALAQTYRPLQIILSDDCSGDRTFKIIQAEARAYFGPHEVVVNRNEHNLGLAGHLNRVAELASGSIIALAAGDDVSSPDRVSRLVEVFRANSAIKAVMSGYTEINSGGDPLRSVVLPRDFQLFTGLKQIAKAGGWIGMGATFAYDRECFFLPGSIPGEIVCEDRLLPFRAALLGQIGFVREALVSYRVHDASVSAGTSFKSAEYERKHQAVLLQELEWGLKQRLLTDAQHKSVAKAIERYPRHYLRSRRLAAYPLINRLYSAYRGRDVWQQRSRSWVLAFLGIR